MIVDPLPPHVEMARAFPSQTFLFRCDHCLMIVALELRDIDEPIQVYENKIVLDCPCGGKCTVLRN